MVEKNIILNQDLKILQNYLDENDVQNTNILTNRLISNSVIIENKNAIIYACGLKSLVAKLIKSPDPEKIGQKFDIIKSFIDNNKNPINDINKTLNELLKAHQKINKNSVKIEYEIYTEDYIFVKKGIDFFLNSFLQDIENDAFLIDKYQVFIGLLSEIELLTRSHGLDVESLILMILIDFLNRVFTYYQYLFSYDFASKNEYWNKKWNIFISQCNVLFSCYIKNENFNKKAIEYLISLAKEWRLMFVRFVEPFSIGNYKNPPRIVIDDKIKEKLKEYTKQKIKEDLNIEHEK